MCLRWEGATMDYKEEIILLLNQIKDKELLSFIYEIIKRLLD